MHSKYLLPACVLLLLGLPRPGAADDVGKEVYKKTLAGTVYVISKNGTGTGWVYDKAKKLVVTNYHVVASEEILRLSGPDGPTSRRIVAAPVVGVLFPISLAGNVVRERSFYEQNHDRFAIQAHVRYADPKRDIAFLELESVPESAVALQVAYGKPEPGERVHSVGNPGASGSLWVYTSGTVRAVYQKKLRTAFGEHEFEVVETSAPINPGDSGGPVVNDAGKVVALVQSYRGNARLVSHCIAVSEVQAIAHGVDSVKAPTTVIDYYRAAQTLFRTGQYQEAVEKLNRALELDPNDAESWHLRGSCYFHLRQYHRAVQEMTKAIELFPEALFYYERGLCRNYAKDIAGAIADYNHALGRGHRTPGLFYSRGVAYGKFERWDWAIADYTKAVELDPGNFQALANRADAYYQRAQTAGDADWQRAMNDYQRVLQLAPSGDPNVQAAENGIRLLLRWRDGR